MPTPMKSPRANKFRLVFHPVFWLALALALVSTSCATTGGSNSYGAASSGTVKDATLLMRR